MPGLAEPLALLERAEIDRSTVEAALTRDGALRASQRQLLRYVSPPADTPYPLEYMFHLLGDVRGQQVVDFGCGSGANTLLLTGRGAEVVGVDLSEDLIRIAKRRLEVNGRPGAARFVVGSAHDLPFPDGSVDVLFGNAVLHHLDLARAAREILRVLRGGGRAIFREPVRNSRLVKALRAAIPYRAPDVSPYERPLTDGEVSSVAQQFASFRARPFLLPHVAAAQLLPVGRNHAAALYRSDAALLRRYPWLRYYAGIRVFELTK